MTMEYGEGDTYSKFNTLFNEGVSAAGQATKLELATVTKSAPDLEIELDADKLPIAKESLVVAEHLTQHKRIMTLRKCEDARFQSEYPRAFSTDIRVASTSVDSSLDPPGHVIVEIALNDVQDDFKAVDVEVEYQDELRKGDRVLVACLDADMTYIILDRARWYE